MSYDHATTDPAAHGQQDGHHEPVSVKTYTIVFASLMVLLAISIWVGRFDLGDLNVVVALGISVVKTILIMLFFMHLIQSSRLIQLVAVGGLLWFGLLLVLMFSDYVSRGWHSDQLPQYHGTAIDRVQTLRPGEERVPVHQGPAQQ